MRTFERELLSAVDVVPSCRPVLTGKQYAGRDFVVWVRCDDHLIVRIDVYSGRYDALAFRHVNPLVHPWAIGRRGVYRGVGVDASPAELLVPPGRTEVASRALYAPPDFVGGEPRSGPAVGGCEQVGNPRDERGGHARAAPGLVYVEWKLLRWNGREDVIAGCSDVHPSPVVGALTRKRVEKGQPVVPVGGGYRYGVGVGGGVARSVGAFVARGGHDHGAVPIRPSVVDGPFLHQNIVWAA